MNENGIYEVKITETLEKVIAVIAENKEDALQKVTDLYFQSNNDNVILTSDNYTNTDFEFYSNKNNAVTFVLSDGDIVEKYMSINPDDINSFLEKGISNYISDIAHIFDLVMDCEKRKFTIFDSANNIIHEEEGVFEFSYFENILKHYFLLGFKPSEPPIGVEVINEGNEQK